MSVPVSTAGSKTLASAPSRPPSAMIVGMPAAAALRAASSLDAMPPVPTLVRCHEADLTDGGRRLPPLDAAPARPEPRGTGGHGPRADDDDLPAAADQPRDLGGDRPHPLSPQPARAGEHVAAHLDDGAPRPAEQPCLLDELAHGAVAAAAAVSPLARARRTASATTLVSAAVPSPVAPDTACRLIPRPANASRTAGKRARVSARSSFPATTICGFAASRGLVSSSSRLIAS